MLRGIVRFFTTLLVVALLYATNTPQGASAQIQACAPLTPPSVPNSLTPIPATPGIIVINEVLSNPKSIWYCPVTYPVANAPWVELYNPQNQAFDLYSAHASIDIGPNSRPYYLPLGAAIAPRSFLVLFPAMYTHTLASGVTLRLVIGGVTVDQVVLPTLGLDQSYARVPDEANTWQITSTPTIDASNTPALATPTTSQTGAGRYGGSGNSHITGEPSPVKIVNGVQPKWASLHLPTPTAHSNSSDTLSQTLSSPAVGSPASSGMDLSHLILLGLMAIALVLTLFWCWKLFART